MHAVWDTLWQLEFQQTPNQFDIIFTNIILKLKLKTNVGKYAGITSCKLSLGYPHLSWAHLVQISRQGLDTSGADLQLRRCWDGACPLFIITLRIVCYRGERFILVIRILLQNFLSTTIYIIMIKRAAVLKDQKQTSRGYNGLIMQSFPRSI